MKTEKIIVDNLKCGGCANSIKKVLNQIIGVLSVDVIEAANTILINHEGQIAREVFIGKLTKLGYPEEGTTSKLQTVKSYVSCAIGRFS